MNCDETFDAGILYATDAYKKVCRFNKELHADLEKFRSENDKLRELCADIRICARDNECSLCYLTSEKCDFSDRMRELGVEA